MIPYFCDIVVPVFISLSPSESYLSQNSNQKLIDIVINP